MSAFNQKVKPGDMTNFRLHLSLIKAYMLSTKSAARYPFDDQLRTIKDVNAITASGLYKLTKDSRNYTNPEDTSNQFWYEPDQDTTGLVRQGVAYLYVTPLCENFIRQYSLIGANGHIDVNTRLGEKSESSVTWGRWRPYADENPNYEMLKDDVAKVNTNYISFGSFKLSLPKATECNCGDVVRLDQWKGTGSVVCEGDGLETETNPVMIDVSRDLICTLGEDKFTLISDSIYDWSDGTHIITTIFKDDMFYWSFVVNGVETHRSNENVFEAEDPTTATFKAMVVGAPTPSFEFSPTSTADNAIDCCNTYEFEVMNDHTPYNSEFNYWNLFIFNNSKDTTAKWMDYYNRAIRDLKREDTIIHSRITTVSGELSTLITTVSGDLKTYTDKSIRAHNYDEESHPDIRAMIAAAGSAGADGWKEALKQHNLSPEAHEVRFSDVYAGMTAISQYAQYVSWANSSYTTITSEKITDYVTQLSWNVSSTIYQVSGDISATLYLESGNITDYVTQLSWNVSSTIYQVSGDITNYVNLVSANISTTIYQVSGDISTTLYTVSGDITEYVTNVSSSISSTIYQVSGDITDYINLVSSNISVTLYTVSGDITDYVTHMSADISTTIYNVSGDITSYINVVSNNISNTIWTISNDITNRIDTVSEGLFMYINTVSHDLSNYVDVTSYGIMEYVTQLSAGVTSYIINVSGDFIDYINIVSNSISRTVWNISGDITNYVTQLSADVSDTIYNVSADITDYVNIVSGGISTTVWNISGDITSYVNVVSNNITNYIFGMSGELVSYTNTVSGDLVSYINVVSDTIISYIGNQSAISYSSLDTELHNGVQIALNGKDVSATGKPPITNGVNGDYGVVKTVSTIPEAKIDVTTTYETANGTVSTILNPGDTVIVPTVNAVVDAITSLKQTIIETSGIQDISAYSGLVASAKNNSALYEISGKPASFNEYGMVYVDQSVESLTSTDLKSAIMVPTVNAVWDHTISKINRKDIDSATRLGVRLLTSTTTTNNSFHLSAAGVAAVGTYHKGEYFGVVKTVSVIPNFKSAFDSTDSYTNPETGLTVEVANPGDKYVVPTVNAVWSKFVGVLYDSNIDNDYHLGVRLAVSYDANNFSYIHLMAVAKPAYGSFAQGDNRFGVVKTINSLPTDPVSLYESSDELINPVTKETTAVASPGNSYVVPTVNAVLKYGSLFLRASDVDTTVHNAVRLVLDNANSHHYLSAAGSPAVSGFHTGNSFGVVKTVNHIALYTDSNYSFVESRDPGVYYPGTTTPSNVANPGDKYVVPTVNAIIQEKYIKSVSGMGPISVVLTSEYVDDGAGGEKKLVYSQYLRVGLHHVTEFENGVALDVITGLSDGYYVKALKVSAQQPDADKQLGTVKTSSKLKRVTGNSSNYTVPTVNAVMDAITSSACLVSVVSGLESSLDSDHILWISGLPANLRASYGMVYTYNSSRLKTITGATSDYTVPTVNAVLSELSHYVAHKDIDESKHFGVRLFTSENGNNHSFTLSAMGIPATGQFYSSNNSNFGTVKTVSRFPYAKSVEGTTYKDSHPRFESVDILEFPDDTFTVVSHPGNSYVVPTINAVWSEYRDVVRRSNVTDDKYRYGVKMYTSYNALANEFWFAPHGKYANPLDVLDHVGWKGDSRFGVVKTINALQKTTDDGVTMVNPRYLPIRNNSNYEDTLSWPIGAGEEIQITNMCDSYLVPTVNAVLSALGNYVERVSSIAPIYVKDYVGPYQYQQPVLSLSLYDHMQGGVILELNNPGNNAKLAVSAQQPDASTKLGTVKTSDTIMPFSARYVTGVTSNYTVPTVNAVIDALSHVQEDFLISTISGIGSSVTSKGVLWISGLPADSTTSYGMVYTKLYLESVTKATSDYTVPTVNAVLDELKAYLRWDQVYDGDSPTIAVGFGANFYKYHSPDGRTNQLVTYNDLPTGYANSANPRLGSFGVVMTQSDLTSVTNIVSTHVPIYSDGESVFISGNPGDQYIVPTVNAVVHEFDKVSKTLTSVVWRSDVHSNIRLGVRLLTSINTETNSFYLSATGIPASGIFSSGERFGTVKTISKFPAGKTVPGADGHNYTDKHPKFESSDKIIFPMDSELTVVSEPGESYVVPTVNAVWSEYRDVVRQSEFYDENYRIGVKLFTSLNPYNNEFFVGAAGRIPNGQFMSGDYFGVVKPISKMPDGKWVDGDDGSRYYDYHPKFERLDSVRLPFATTITSDISAGDSYVVPTVNAVWSAYRDVVRQSEVYDDKYRIGVRLQTSYNPFNNEFFVVAHGSPAFPIGVGISKGERFGIVKTMSHIPTTIDDGQTLVARRYLPLTIDDSYTHRGEDIVVENAANLYIVPTVNAVIGMLDSYVERVSSVAPIYVTDYEGITHHQQPVVHLSIYPYAIKGVSLVVSAGDLAVSADQPDAGTRYGTVRTSSKIMPRSLYYVTDETSNYTVPTVNAVLDALGMISAGIVDYSFDFNTYNGVLLTSTDYGIAAMGVPVQTNEGDSYGDYGVVKTISEIPDEPIAVDLTFTDSNSVALTIEGAGDLCIVPTVNAIVNKFSEYVPWSAVNELAYDDRNVMHVFGADWMIREFTVDNTAKREIIPFNHPASGNGYDLGTATMIPGFGVVATWSTLTSITETINTTVPIYSGNNKSVIQLVGNPGDIYVVPTVNAVVNALEKLKRGDVSISAISGLTSSFDPITSTYWISGLPANELTSYGMVYTYDNLLLNFITEASAYTVPTVNAAIRTFVPWLGIDVAEQDEQDTQAFGGDMTIRYDDDGNPITLYAYNHPASGSGMGTVYSSYLKDFGTVLTISKIERINATIVSTYQVHEDTQNGGVYVSGNPGYQYVVPTVNAVADELDKLTSAMYNVSVISGLTSSIDRVSRILWISGLPANALTSYGMVYTKTDSIYFRMTGETSNYTVPTVNAALDTFVPWMGIDVGEQEQDDVTAFGANQTIRYVEDDDGVARPVQLVTYNHPASGSGMETVHSRYEKDFGVVLTWSKVEHIDDTLVSTYAVKAGGLNGYVGVSGNPGDQYVVPTVNAVRSAIDEVSNGMFMISAISGLTSSFDSVSKIMWISGLPANELTSYGMVYTYDRLMLNFIEEASAYTVPTVNAALKTFVPWLGVDIAEQDEQDTQAFGGDMTIRYDDDGNPIMLYAYNHPASGSGMNTRDSSYLKDFGTVLTVSKIERINTTITSLYQVHSDTQNGDVYVSGNPGYQYVVPTVNAVVDELDKLTSSIYDISAISGLTSSIDRVSRIVWISGLPANALTSYGMVYTKTDSIYTRVVGETSNYTVPTVNAALDTFVPWMGVDVGEQEQDEVTAFGANLTIRYLEDADGVARPTQLITYNHPASGSGMETEESRFEKDFGVVLTWSKLERIDETLISAYQVKAGTLNGYVGVDGNPGDQYVVPTVNAVVDEFSKYIPWNDVLDDQRRLGGNLYISYYHDETSNIDIPAGLLAFNTPATGKGWIVSGGKTYDNFGVVVTTDTLTSITTTIDEELIIDSITSGDVSELHISGNPGNLFVVPTVNAVANALAKLQTVIEFDSSIYNGVQLTSMPGLGVAAMGLPVTSNKSVSDYGDFGVVKTIPELPKEPIVDSVVYTADDGSTSTIYNAADLCLVPTVNAVVNRIKEIGSAIEGTGVKKINVYSGLTLVSDAFGVYDISGLPAFGLTSYGMVYTAEILNRVMGATSIYTVPTVNAVLDTFVPWDGVDQNAHWEWDKFTFGANLLVHYATDEETGESYPVSLMPFNRPASGTGLSSGEDGVRHLKDFGVVLTLNMISHIDMDITSTYIVDGDNVLFGHVGVSGNPGDQYIVPTMNAVADEFADVVYWEDIKAKPYQDYGYQTLGASLYILTSEDETTGNTVSRSLVAYNTPPYYTYNLGLDGSTLDNGHFGVVIPTNQVAYVSTEFNTSIEVSPEWDDNKVTVPLTGKLGDQFIVPTVNAVWSAVPKMHSAYDYGVNVKIDADSFTSVYGTPAHSYNIGTTIHESAGAVKAIDGITYIEPNISDVSGFFEYQYTVPTMNAVSSALTEISGIADALEGQIAEVAGRLPGYVNPIANIDGYVSLLHTADWNYGVGLETSETTDGTRVLMANARPAYFGLGADETSSAGTVYTCDRLVQMDVNEQDAYGNEPWRFTVPTLKLLASVSDSITQWAYALPVPPISYNADRTRISLAYDTTYENGVRLLTKTSEYHNAQDQLVSTDVYLAAEAQHADILYNGTTPIGSQIGTVFTWNAMSRTTNDTADYTVPTMNLLCDVSEGITQAIAGAGVGAISPLSKVGNNIELYWNTGDWYYGVGLLTSKLTDDGPTYLFADADPAHSTTDGTNVAYHPGTVRALPSLQAVPGNDDHDVPLSAYTVPTMTALGSVSADIAEYVRQLTPPTIITGTSQGVTVSNNNGYHFYGETAWFHDTNDTYTLGVVRTMNTIAYVEEDTEDAAGNFVFKYTVPTMNALCMVSSAITNVIGGAIPPISRDPDYHRLSLGWDGTNDLYGVRLSTIGDGTPYDPDIKLVAVARPATTYRGGTTTYGAGTVRAVGDKSYIEGTDTSGQPLADYTVPTMNLLCTISQEIAAVIEGGGTGGGEPYVGVLPIKIDPVTQDGTVISSNVSLLYNSNNVRGIKLTLSNNSYLTPSVSYGSTRTNSNAGCGVVFVDADITSMAAAQYNNSQGKHTVPNVNAVYNFFMTSIVSAIDSYMANHAW